MRRTLPVFACLFVLVTEIAQGAVNNYLLELDGTHIGLLHSADGGVISSTVVTEIIGATATPKKHLGAKVVEPMELSFGLDVNANLFDLIDRSFGAAPAPLVSGEILNTDANFKIKERRDFVGAFITEVDFPAMDAASKDAGELKIHLKPTDIQTSDGGGATAPTTIKPTKTWNVANFRVELDGLDATRVRRVEPITFKRTGETTKGVADYSNLKISLAEAGVASWKQWYEDFVVKGNDGDGQEKSGDIILYAADFKTEIARFNLKQCGIYRLAPTKNADGSTLDGSQTAELYCEFMEFAYKR